MDKQPLELQLLLDAIYALSGYDFREYNHSSILRRIEHRRRLEQLPTITHLTAEIIHNEPLLHTVLNDFSINVTEMFRDPLFFRTLRNDVLPKLAHLKRIRIWHAGCATGEEAYSMAILLKEQGLLERATIYATDMNEQVLSRAKEGAFSLQKMQDYTKNYLLAGGEEAFSDYYKTEQNRAIFHQTLRDAITFAQHNLVTDQSFQEFDMILCRNVLIYFSVPLQHKVQKLFYESLAQGGYLGLGDKETIQFTPIARYYHAIDAAERIYQKS